MTRDLVLWGQGQYEGQTLVGDLDLLKVTEGEGVPPHVGSSEELQSRRVGQRALQLSEGRGVGHHAACLGLVLQSH